MHIYVISPPPPFLLVFFFLRVWNRKENTFEEGYRPLSMSLCLSVSLPGFTHFFDFVFSPLCSFQVLQCRDTAAALWGEHVVIAPALV